MDNNYKLYKCIFGNIYIRKIIFDFINGTGYKYNDINLKYFANNGKQVNIELLKDKLKIGIPFQDITGESFYKFLRKFQIHQQQQYSTVIEYDQILTWFYEINKDKIPTGISIDNYDTIETLINTKCLVLLKIYLGNKLKEREQIKLKDKLKYYKSALSGGDLIIVGYIHSHLKLNLNKIKELLQWAMESSNRDEMVEYLLNEMGFIIPTWVGSVFKVNFYQNLKKLRFNQIKIILESGLISQYIQANVHSFIENSNYIKSIEPIITTTKTTPTIHNDYLPFNKVLDFIQSSIYISTNVPQLYTDNQISIYKDCLIKIQLLIKYNDSNYKDDSDLYSLSIKKEIINIQNGNGNLLKYFESLFKSSSSSITNINFNQFNLEREIRRIYIFQYLCDNKSLISIEDLSNFIIQFMSSFKEYHLFENLKQIVQFNDDQKLNQTQNKKSQSNFVSKIFTIAFDNADSTLIHLMYNDNDFKSILEYYNTFPYNHLFIQLFNCNLIDISKQIEFLNSFTIIKPLIQPLRFEYILKHIFQESNNENLSNDNLNSITNVIESFYITYKYRYPNFILDIKCLNNNINVINYFENIYKVYHSTTEKGDWSQVENWKVFQNNMTSDGELPIQDYASLGYDQSTTVTNSYIKAVALNISMGYGTNVVLMSTDYGVQSDFLIISSISEFRFTIKGDPFTNIDYRVDLNEIMNYGILRTIGGNMYAPNAYFTLYQNSGWVVQDCITSGFLLQSEYAQLIISNSTADILGSSVWLSTWTILDSNFLLSGLYSFTVDYGSSLTVTNTNFTCFNSFKTLNNYTEVSFSYSNITLVNSINIIKSTFQDSTVMFDHSQIDIYHQFLVNGLNREYRPVLFVSNSNMTTYDEFRVIDYAVFRLYNSTLSTDNLRFRNSSDAVIRNSEISITGECEFNDFSQFQLINSNLTAIKSLFFSNDAIGFIQYSNILIYGDFATLDNSNVLLNQSVFTISTDNNPYPIFPNRIFALRGTSSLIFNFNSVGNLDAHLVVFDHSNLQALDSTITISKLTVFLNFSKIVMEKSAMHINDQLVMMGSSLFSVDTSFVQVKYRTAFVDFAQYKVVNSDFLVIGYFYDTSNNQSFIDNSNVNVTGEWISSSKNHFVNSIVSIGGNFTNFGSIISTTTNFTIQGSLNNAQVSIFYLEHGSITILEGEMVVGKQANLTALNSRITIMKGTLTMESKSTLSLLNTTLHNKGQVKTIGEIIINKGGNLLNDALFDLDSNVIPIDNNGDEMFINSGTINIIGVSVNNKTNVTTIKVPLKNSGIINIGRETEFISFIQIEGGLLKLNNSIVHSENVITFDSSSLQGNGTLNATFKSSNVTIFDNSVSKLNVRGDFNSIGDVIKFTIHGIEDDSSSLLSIVNNATINNSTLVIRININLITNKPSNTTLIDKTLISYDNLFGSGFSNIKFNTYDPNTGIEKEMDECYAKKAESRSKTNFNLLISNIDCKTDSKSVLSVGAIVGIVVGAVALSAAVGVHIYFRNNLIITKSFLRKKLLCL